MYVSDMRINNKTNPIASSLYGVCLTAADEPSKVVDLSDFHKLKVGVTISIKFSNSNTAPNPTLNVNNTGKIPLYKYGSTPPIDSEGGSWRPGEIIFATYDGASWMIDGYNDEFEGISSADVETVFSD